MRHSLLAVVAAAALVQSAGAAAVGSTVSFNESDVNGDGTMITFGGDKTGTSATLFLQLTGYDDDANLFTFYYNVTNTSSLEYNPEGRVSGFGFGVNPDAGLTGGNVTGTYSSFVLDPAPGQLGDAVDVCASNGGTSDGTKKNGGAGGPSDCSGKGGVLVGTPGSGTLSLKYSLDVKHVSFSDFAVRYQSLGLTGDDSGRGYLASMATISAVPEASTWAMMLFGFGAVGFAMRRRKTVDALKSLTA